MPSDEREERALDALAGCRTRFRAAVETGQAQARAFLAGHGLRTDERTCETALELGQFAAGRVDAARFASLVASARVLSPEEEAVVRRCADVMDEVLARRDGLFACDVPPGGDLRAAVEAALAEAGRAFGAAAAVQAVKSGTYQAAHHAAALRAFPFRRWTRAERMLAPPLVVSVEGADLHAGALADYLDGQQKIVVLARGAVTPAPLVALVAPRRYVAQLSAADALAGALLPAAAFDGPAIAALVPDACARFTHDPGAGPTLDRRLRVLAIPKDAPRAAVGGQSVTQQREELARLAELAELAAQAVRVSAADASTSEGAARPPTAGAPPGATDERAVSALTAWLLTQAGFQTASGAGTGGARP